MDGFAHILFVPLADRICNDHIRPERDANEQIDNQADQRAVCAHSRDGGGAVGPGKLPITALFSCRGKRREHYARRREPAYFSALPIQAAHGAGAGGREAAGCRAVLSPAFTGPGASPCAGLETVYRVQQSSRNIFADIQRRFCNEIRKILTFR